jgi:hypothetical protein
VTLAVTSVVPSSLILVKQTQIQFNLLHIMLGVLCKIRIIFNKFVAGGKWVCDQDTEVHSHSIVKLLLSFKLLHFNILKMATDVFKVYTSISGASSEIQNGDLPSTHYHMLLTCTFLQ